MLRSFVLHRKLKSIGDWYPWKTVTLPHIKMDPGKNKQLKAIFAKGGFKPNWLNIK